MVDEVPALRMGREHYAHSNTMLSSGRCTTVTRPALAHWVHSATCFPHWGNGRSRAQWEKNLTCLAFMSTFFLFRFSALPFDSEYNGILLATKQVAELVVEAQKHVSMPLGESVDVVPSLPVVKRPQV